MQPRDVQFKLLLTADERAALSKLAGARGLSASDWLRLAIRQEAEQAVPPIRIQPVTTDEP